MYGEMTLGEGAKITRGEKVGSIIVHIIKKEVGPLPYVLKFLNYFQIYLNLKHKTYSCRTPNGNIDIGDILFYL
jgi:hypothetical protein